MAFPDPPIADAPIADPPDAVADAVADATNSPDDRAQQVRRGVAALRRTFGRFVNEDVLAAVLDMHDLDIQRATDFLEGGSSAPSLQNYVPGSAAAELRSLPEGYLTINDSRLLSVAPSPAPGAADGMAVAQAPGPVKIFTEAATYAEHVSALQADHAGYFACLCQLLQLGVDIKGNRSRALAALWATHHFGAAQLLLKTAGFGLPEVLKALNILDAPRRLRALEKRASRLQRLGNVRPSTLSRLQMAMNDLKRESVPVGSVSGALARRLQKWVETIPAKQLLFFCLQLPKEPWKQLADLLHLNPTKLTAAWFLPNAFSATTLSDLPVADAVNLTPDTAFETIKTHQLPYAYLRLQRDILTDEIKGLVATYESLDTCIWWYEELACPAVDECLRERLSQPDVKLSLGYGHLLDRMLALRMLGSPLFTLLTPIAEKRLGEYKLKMTPPVACFGDASSSMDVAIRVATITASFLTALVSAELNFFRTDVEIPESPPRSIADVIHMAVHTKASGMTSPASSLWPYYEKKIKLETVIVVTDEEENTRSHGYYFAELFAKYRQDVHPAKIVLVSFLKDPQKHGIMRTALARFNIEPVCAIALNANQPDLSKLDALLGLLSLESHEFGVQMTKLRSSLAASAHDHPAGMEEDDYRAVLASNNIVLAKSPDFVE